ncbi:MAG: aminotransferase class I/II-fold pyridoxal phosphate-dependent enzyme, partial [Marinobacter sp.]|nr:aminotransferase class I/II-fold pyridoxal phosphate-dependent enzyme [Marinobacter sp.]
GMPGLVVMRSLGKFFGLAGLRAGAVLTDADIATALEDALGPWPLSGPARYVMAAALADVPWQAATTQRLQGDSRRLHELLAGHGLPGSQGTLLFRYLAHPRALAITESLASRGILVRSFDALYAPDSLPALRLGLPGHEDEWQTLARGLAGLANVIDQ